MMRTMPPLPFNLGIDRLLRRRVKAALFAAPVLLLVASSVALVVLDNWAKTVIGLPSCASFAEHAHRELIESFVLLGWCCLAFVGYLLGWVLNAVYLRACAHWPWPAVLATMLRSEVPQTWMRNRMPSEDERNEMREEFEHWSAKRFGGARRFILKEGVLKIGGGWFTVMLIARALKDDPVLAANSWPMLLAMALLLGLLLGALLWFWREHRYLYRRQLLADD